MAIMSSYNKNPIILFLSWLLFSSNSLHASEDPQRKPTTKVVVIGGGGECNYGSTLKDIPNYAELKHDPKASLPSSFTICVSVLATTQNLNPILFSLLGNDGRQLFSAQIKQNLGDFVGKKFFYPEASQYVNLDTVPAFPNEWV